MPHDSTRSPPFTNAIYFQLKETSMPMNSLLKTRLSITAIISLSIWGLLLWNYFNGGIPSHHLLAKEELPEISNGWGGLSLPLFSWLMIYRIQRREKLTGVKFPNHVLIAFLIALIYGIVLSVFFSFGLNDIPFYMFIGGWITALFFPIYRAECLLGFVIGLTCTFGAVLPMFIGFVITAIGFVIHQVIRSFSLFLIAKAR
jgi:hypothetical protein